MTSGTVIIAAHNEEMVIGRTLDALSEVVADGTLAVIVVCNGCTDRTAEIARRPGIVVTELSEAGKALALRRGDELSDHGPRIYLDADVTLTSRAARDLASALAAGTIAGRPPCTFDTRTASRIVRRWYQVRTDLPTISSALWGAGCYAMSAEGRARFEEFPDLISDDLFVDSQFSPAEISIINTDPVVVTTPRRLTDLIRILRRSYRTQAEVVHEGRRLSQGQQGQLRDLRRIVARTPLRIVDVILYATVIGYARLRVRLVPGSLRWERDESSRKER